MAVASRDHAIFDQSVLSWSQMDAMVAIVNVNGHEVFFDPGTRLCPFAHVAPWHSNVTGVSTEAKLVKIRMTPEESYKSSGIQRLADLTLAPDGGVSGKVTIAWLGNAGLQLRRNRLREDAQAAEKQVEIQVQGLVPEGVEIKLLSLDGLDDGEAPLTATFNVSGRMGIATGKRMLLPAQFFSARGKRMLAPQTRTMPLVFPESGVTGDRVILRLPPELTVEALPDQRRFAVGQDMAYQAVVQSGTAQQSPGQMLLVAQRTQLLKRIDYKPEEYAALHQYFGDVAGADGEQIVLKPLAAAQASTEKPRGK